MKTATQRYYHEARTIGGMTAVHALRTARILVQWDELEAQDRVRLRAEGEEENYFDVYGEPEAYEGLNGKRVSAEEARKEMEESLERDGCWVCYAEWFDGKDWHIADSIGMCAGYKNPLNWQENWYIPDLMESAIEQVIIYRGERQWASECALVN